MTTSNTLSTEQLALASKVAKYLALSVTLREDSPKEDYRQANELCWELAMVLPSEVYKRMIKGIITRDASANELMTVIDVRKLVLGEAAGSLNSQDVAAHAPAIAKQRANQNQPPAESLKNPTAA